MSSPTESDPSWVLGRPRVLRTGQRTEIWIGDVEGEARRVHVDDAVLFEAPNWAPDGDALLLNGDGLLWRLELDEGAAPQPVAIEDLPPINNDHVIDAERGLIYLSANDGHIHVAPLTGGAATRVTSAEDRFHFLHGVSPDGATLAFVELTVGDWGAGRLATIASSGGDTTYPDAGTRHLDGPEYSPDGRLIYCNTEEYATAPGHAQLARLPAGGGRFERLVTSDTVDWFPHLSPDGSWATYITFPAGTEGHPADLDVEVRLVRTADWTEVVARFPLPGGQGTLNVNSWAPDSRRFAFVSYPLG